MEYQTSRKCTLMQVGELLDSKGYGIALPMGKYRLKKFLNPTNFPHFLQTHHIESILVRKF